ncbi:MAG: hypothetical protein R3D68_12235 [Hyphomicrobiaceae bacterium]
MCKRIDRKAWRSAAIAALLLVSATAGAQASPLSFPADGPLVPFVIGAAFALPAVAAYFYAIVHAALGRRGRMVGPIAALGLLAGVGLAATAYLQPGMLSGIGI